METMKEFIEILKSEPNRAFDFIANNGYKFSKDELRVIAQELIYGIYVESTHGLITEADHDKILANTAETLEEAYMED